MEEDGETSSPFWMQNSSARHRNGSSNVFLSSGFLIVVLPLIALLVMVFVIPPIVSFTSEIVKPNLVKKSWDNVNLVLVLFAILCGILGRRRNGNGEEDENVVRNVIPRAPEEQLHQQLSQRQDHWFGYNNGGSQQLEYDHQRTSSEDLRWSGSHLVDSNTRMIGRPMRNSSSYPDLRQESLWSSYPNDNWRFSSDDNDLYRFRSTSPPPVHHRSRSVHDDYDGAQGSGIVKTIPVDTFVARSTNRPEPSSSPIPKPILKPIHSAPVPLPPPPPQQLQKEIKPRVKRITKPRENVQAVEDEDVGLEKPMQESLVTQPPPPPPPPLAPRTSRLVENKSSSKSSDHRRRGSGGGAKDIATTLASFYNQRKRKKKQQQQKSKENYDDILQALSHNSGGASTTPPPPPPLPPPPPPASVFQQLFKKGNKNKRIHSSSPMTSPPPPPPPPPPPHASTSSKRKTTHIRQSSVPSPPPPPPPPAPAPVVPEKRKPLTPHRPPFPTKNTSFNEDEDESLNSGWQSPLIPMPPPPPPPPFKMPEFKYVVQGDFIRLRSTQSSCSTSPDLDSNDSPVTPSSPQLQSDHQGGEALAGTSAFCASPDVNTKAETFIARFRAGLKLEKNNSIKLKQDIGSRPGSSLRPSTSKNPT